MKASIYKKYGVDNLKIVDIDKPIPKENEILVKVHAATVNRSDCAMLVAPHVMRLFTGLFRPRNPILGTDFAGEIVGAGNKVTKYKVGDKVFGFNDMGLKSHAEYLKISEKEAIGIIPDNLSYQEATSCIEGAHYAYNFLNKVPLKEGEKAMVYGASGAIGSATVQLLKYFKAEVTGVCNTKNLDIVKSIGADKVVDYTKEDFTKINKTFDYVFDAVGKSSFSNCKPLLRKGGIYMSSELGKGSQNVFLSLLTPIFGKKKVKFPFPTNRPGSVELMRKIINEGKYKSVIDRTYPLEEVAEAFRYVLTGQKTGNVVLTMGNEEKQPR